MRLRQKLIIPIATVLMLLTPISEGIINSYNGVSKPSSQIEMILKDMHSNSFKNKIEKLDSMQFRNWKEFSRQLRPILQIIADIAQSMETEEEKNIAFKSIISAVNRAEEIKDSPPNGFVHLIIYGITKCNKEELNYPELGGLVFLSLSNKAQSDFLYFSALMADPSDKETQSPNAACLMDEFEKNPDLLLRSIYLNMIDSWDLHSLPFNDSKVFGNIYEIARR